MNNIIKTLKYLQKHEVDEKVTGTNYENYVAETILEHDKDLLFVSNEEWKTNYSEYRTSYLNCEKEHLHNFKNLTLASGKQADNLVIYQPNGSQQSPDILIIKNGLGLFIEVKTSKSNPAWNSGRLYNSGFYIFKNYKLKEVTFFTKDTVIDKLLDSVIDELTNKIKSLTKEYTSIFDKYSTKEFNWNYDFRPILQDKNDYFGPLRNHRENKVIHFLSSIR